MYLRAPGFFDNRTIIPDLTLRGELSSGGISNPTRVLAPRGLSIWETVTLPGEKTTPSLHISGIPLWIQRGIEEVQGKLG